MKTTWLFSLLMTSTLLQAQQNDRIQVPPTRKDAVKESYFGKAVMDPYRWLEDDNSAETKAWVDIQNQITFDYLNNIPFRKEVMTNLQKQWNFTKYGNMRKEGDYYTYYKNDGLQNQSVLYIQRGKDGRPEVFLDPNTLDAAGTTSLGSVSFSKNQKLCAYSVSKAGSDWQDIYVMNVASRKLVSDKISYSKFSGISWKGDEGFYYSGYDKPDEKNKYSAKTEFQKIFYHQIGTEQSTDKLIFEDKSNPLLYKGVAITDDQKWLMLSLSQGTDGSELRVMNLSNPKEGFKTICPGYQNNVEFIDGVDGKFLVYTNFEAPNYKVVLIDPSKPDLDHWQLIVPESNHKLESVQFVGGKLICNYLQNASSKVDVYTLEGKMESSVPLPGIGTASGFDGERNDDHTFFTFTSYNVAPTIYRYDIRFNRIEPVLIPNVSFDPNKYVVQQMRFKSKDGTEVPMFVYHRADIDLKKGPFPVLLYGYGGFNISLTPSFSIPLNYFVEQGGVYVSVSLRGGGEFGENWHQAGMLDRKQNVFDDFIGAAEYLIEKGITSKEKLAIHGRSNGGLLVGACMTQRPDLFKVALPGVGVLDMLRYHKFTVGWGWVVEYGSSDKEQDFNYLIKYSPLHNLKPGTRYPATLITTADHDDRVVPAHSFKFAAALQEANRSANPTLIRIDKQAGHGAGKPTSKQIEEWADVLSFTMYHLGMNNSMPQR